MSKKMILKINEKGLTVKLPGMAEFRTPAQVDVTNIPLQTMIFKLNEFNIRDYELISYTDTKKIVYTKKPKIVPKQKPEPAELPEEYIDSLNKKFNRLENMLGNLINNTSVRERKDDPKEEQINNRLDRIEKMLNKRPQVVVKSDSANTTEPKIEDDDDFDIFIPPIETEGMKMSGGEHKEIETDDDADETADILSDLLKKE